MIGDALEGDPFRRVTREDASVCHQGRVEMIHGSNFLSTSTIALDLKGLRHKGPYSFAIGMGSAQKAPIERQRSGVTA